MPKTTKLQPKAKKPSAKGKAAGKTTPAAGTVGAAGPQKGAGGLGVSVRMYRLGVGDCFLVRLRRQDNSIYRMLIDCGVHQAQSGGADVIRRVIANLKEKDVADGKIDTLVVTHEHWDHLSGFSQAEAQWRELTVGEIWAAWTEDAKDAVAKNLKAKKKQAIAALGLAEARLRLAGREEAANPIAGLLGFFGDNTGAKLAQAGQVLKSLVPDTRVFYRKPGEAPIQLPGVDARAFVLGPPRDVAAIGRSAPRKGGDEVYAFGAFGAALEALEPALGPDDAGPFDGRFAIPLAGTRSLPFFQRYYWADRAPASELERVDDTQRWRRIDEDWLDAATSLALQLDEDTNNTSLVLAIELGPPDRDGPVLLFAADAQVGNWLSWQKVEWKNYHGRHITGPDLLRRTLLYKVGHHASHNATLKALGLELMEALQVALVPTDDTMAKKVGWGTLPWPNLLDALEVKTKKRVIRTDRDLKTKLEGFEVIADPLFYEVRL